MNNEFTQESINTQIILDCLAKHPFHDGCGWVLINRGLTIHILDSLVEKGIVQKSLTGSMPIYKLI